MITSKTNELVKQIKSLHQKKYRDEYQKYFVEGIKLVKEAIAENMPIDKIVICEELLEEKIDTKQYEVEYVNQAIFEYLSDTKTPQGILAVIPIPATGDGLFWHGNQFDDEQQTDNICSGAHSIEKIRSGAHCAPYNIIFALDNIQDPGNLGTIIRTLDCAGINTLLLSKGTVDLYNPKVIRSTMGAIYRLNIQANVDLKEELLVLKKDGYQVVITDLTASRYHYDLNYQEKLVIVIGNEANGVSEEIKSMADIKIKIPMLRKNRKLECRSCCQHCSI